MMMMMMETTNFGSQVQFMTCPLACYVMLCYVLLYLSFLPFAVSDLIDLSCHPGDCSCVGAAFLGATYR